MVPIVCVFSLKIPDWRSPDSARVAPRIDDWPVLVTQVTDLLKRDYDWTDEERRLLVPVRSWWVTPTACRRATRSNSSSSSAVAGATRAGTDRA